MHLVSAAKRARKREKLSIGRSGTNRAHKFADGKTMADDKTQLGRHIWQHTVISGTPIPRRRGLTPRAATPSFDAPLCEPGGALLQSVNLNENPKVEQFRLEKSAELFDFYSSFFREIRDEYKKII